MPEEERRQVRLTALVEHGEAEGHEPDQHQERRQKDVRDGRVEVGLELSLEDCLNVLHHFASFMVRLRKTTSSLPLGSIAFSSSGVPSNFFSPSEMTTTFVQTASTSSRICVEMMIALPLAAMSLIMLRTVNFWFGSRPSVGSSMISTFGSC